MTTTALFDPAHPGESRDPGRRLLKGNHKGHKGHEGHEGAPAARGSHARIVVTSRRVERAFGVLRVLRGAIGLKRLRPASSPAWVPAFAGMSGIGGGARVAIRGIILL